MIRSMRTSPSGPVPIAMTLAVIATLAGCGGGGSGDGAPSITPSASDAGGGDPDSDPDGAIDGSGSVVDGGGADVPTPIAGDIALYGVVAIGDEDGEASGDALASFSRLSASVAPEAFGAALVPTRSLCAVEPYDGLPDLMFVSRLYLPTPEAVALEPIGAGDAVLLSSPVGSYLELQARPSDRFYTRPSGEAPLSGPVPTGLTASVTGGAFPAFADAALPDVAPLEGFAYAGGDTIGRDTRFTWQAADNGGVSVGGRIRIETASVGAFFSEDGSTVSCLVPDTGEFVFPADVRAALGADFEGEIPDVSRISIGSVQDGNALLVLVRESFAR